MKPQKNFSKVALLAIAFAPLVMLSGHAQILADAAANYQAGTIDAVMTPLTDTHGTGTWTYNSVFVDSDTNPTSISNPAILTYEANTEGGSQPYYGTNGNYSNSIINLPAVSSGQIFTDSPAPGADFLEIHPSQGTNAGALEWTAGAGETGNLVVTFDLSRVGVGNDGIQPGQGLDDFIVLRNGTSIYSEDNLTIGSDTGAVSLALTGVTLGTQLDFVVSAGNGVLGYNLSYLSADISEAPEPATWALMILGGLVFFAGTRRLASRRFAA
jgi:hypothetical protein